MLGESRISSAHGARKVGSGFERQGEESHGGTYTLGDGIEDLVCGGLQVEEGAAEVAVPGGAGRPAPSSVLRDPQHPPLYLSLSVSTVCPQ